MALCRTCRFPSHHGSCSDIGSPQWWAIQAENRIGLQLTPAQLRRALHPDRWWIRLLCVAIPRRLMP